MGQEHRPEKATCVTECSSCIISGVLQQVFSSEYVQSQQKLNIVEQFQTFTKCWKMQP